MRAITRAVKAGSLSGLAVLALGLALAACAAPRSALLGPAPAGSGTDTDAYGPGPVVPSRTVRVVARTDALPPAMVLADAAPLGVRSAPAAAPAPRWAPAAPPPTLSSAGYQVPPPPPPPRIAADGSIVPTATSVWRAPLTAAAPRPLAAPSPVLRRGPGPVPVQAPRIQAPPRAPQIPVARPSGLRVGAGPAALAPRRPADDCGT